MYIHVVDVTHSKPWTVKTYILHLTRRSRPGLRENLSQKHINSLKTCNINQVRRIYSCTRSIKFLSELQKILFQDCDLKFMPSSACGLQPLPRFNTWQDYLHFQQTLSLCKSSDVTGFWMVPCERCDVSATCHWSSATWQLQWCRQENVARNATRVRQCFKKKTVRQW